MEWVDRYVHAVANYLPRDSREDIAQELKDALYEQLEDKREQLGRAVNEEEQKAFLKQLGHPMKVAAGYSPQQHLIGPSLFPGYKHTLKIVSSVVIALQVAITILALFTGGAWHDAMPGFLSRLMYSVITAAGCVTVVFAILEYSGQKLDWYEKWDPSSLPPLQPNLRVNRTDNIFNVVFEMIGLLWWNGAIRFTDAMTVDGSIWHVGLSAGWDVFYWPVNIILLGAIALHGHHLFFEQWNIPKIGLEMVLDIASLIALYFLLRLEPLIVYTGDVSDASEKAHRMAELLDRGVWYLLLVITVISLFELYKHGSIFFRLRR